MNLKELIDKLEILHKEHGDDIEVYYSGGVIDLIEYVRVDEPSWTFMYRKVVELL